MRFLGLCIVAAALLPGIARAECLSDPMRDAAFLDGHRPGCSAPILRYTAVLETDRHGVPRTIVTFEVRESDLVSELRDRMPPWLFAGGVNAPARMPARESVLGLGGHGAQALVGVRVTRTLP